jgi:hypothetical protein
VDTGLRRFVGPPTGTAGVAHGEGLPHGEGRRPSGEERCELCAEPLATPHTHLVDRESRALRCCCRPCYFLFTPEGAAAGRYRPVPDRYLRAQRFVLTAQQWSELSIPVGLLFVFHHSGLDTPVAFYPSPAGATESLLPLDTWAQVRQANPMLIDAAPDVEAVLLRRTAGHNDAYLVPIDACYDLVGRVRLHWRGFSGGETVWQEIDAFFAELAQRAEPVPADVGGE